MTITITKIPTTTGVTVASGAAPATRRTTTIITTTKRRVVIANRDQSHVMQYILRKRRDQGISGVAPPVTIAAEAADRDVGETEEVETDHAPKAEAEVEEGGRVGKLPVPTTLQIHQKKIRKLKTN